MPISFELLRLFPEIHLEFQWMHFNERHSKFGRQMAQSECKQTFYHEAPSVWAPVD